MQCKMYLNSQYVSEDLHPSYMIHSYRITYIWYSKYQCKGVESFCEFKLLDHSYLNTAETFRPENFLTLVSDVQPPPGEQMYNDLTISS